MSGCVSVGSFVLVSIMVDRSRLYRNQEFQTFFTASCLETQHVVISVVSCFSSYRFSKWLEAISVVFHSSHLLWYVPFEGELETLVDSHIVSRHRLACTYPPLLKGHKANLDPTVS